MKRFNGTHPTAEAAYTERLDRVRARLDAVKTALDRRAEAPATWERAGDLGRVDELLRQVERFLASDARA